MAPRRVIEKVYHRYSLQKEQSLNTLYKNPRIKRNTLPDLQTQEGFKYMTLSLGLHELHPGNSPLI